MPNEIQIRKLSKADGEEAWGLRARALELEPTAFGESASEHAQTSVSEYARRWLTATPESFALGAFVDSLVGTARFGREQRLKRRHAAWIHGVFVLPQFRRRGVGRALLQRIVDEARGMVGLECIFLTVAGPQAGALHLYRAMGFRSLCVLPRALKIGESYVDENYMVLNL